VCQFLAESVKGQAEDGRTICRHSADIFLVQNVLVLVILALPYQVVTPAQRWGRISSAQCATPM